MGAFHHGSGRPVLGHNCFALRSAADRTPTATSARTARGTAVPLREPASTSSDNAPTVHRPCCTASDSNSVTSAGDLILRTASVQERTTRGERNAAADHWSGWAHRALDVDELHGADLLVLRDEYVDLRVPAAGVVTSDGTAA
jgi:hypothetical protein